MNRIIITLLLKTNKIKITHGGIKNFKIQRIRGSNKNKSLLINNNLNLVKIIKEVQEDKITSEETKI